MRAEGRTHINWYHSLTLADMTLLPSSGHLVIDKMPSVPTTSFVLLSRPPVCSYLPTSYGSGQSVYFWRVYHSTGRHLHITRVSRRKHDRQISQTDASF